MTSGATVPTTFYDVSGEELDHWDVPFPLPNNAGIVFDDGRRYRVVDTWLTLERHGRFHFGYHIFLEKVEGTSDDPLGDAAPEYFRKERGGPSW